MLLQPAQNEAGVEVVPVEKHRLESRSVFMQVSSGKAVLKEKEVDMCIFTDSS